jgi:hypothetical protein
MAFHAVQIQTKGESRLAGEDSFFLRDGRFSYLHGVWEGRWSDVWDTDRLSSALLIGGGTADPYRSHWRRVFS